MPDKIAILGCGPAGMFAAHAAAQLGVDFTIYSKNRKSYMRGAQYLHEPIPGLSSDPFMVEYTLKGDVDGYREKVYGDMGDILVSPESLVGISPAWDIREAYDAAWDLYGDRVVDWDATKERGLIQHFVGSHDLVFSSVPANAICEFPKFHQFKSQIVWATEAVKSFGEFELDSDGDMVDDLVVCSGDPQDWWYRQSRIRGWENTEFPHNHKPHFGDGSKVHRVVKPLSTTCNCFPEIHRIGRYGVWKKGVLSHEAYNEAFTTISANMTKEYN